MVKNLIPAGSCALFLTGCVNLLAQKPDPATAVDAVKFTDHPNFSANIRNAPQLAD